jgi:hypothetical protein
MPYGNLLADVVQGSTANTPPVFKDGNGTTIGTLCRAWVNFNGTGTVAINGSFNVSSITDNGTGDYTVNFTTALPDANYSICGFVSLNGLSTSANIIGGTNFSRTTSLVRLQSASISAIVDFTTVSVNIFR